MEDNESTEQSREPISVYHLIYISLEQFAEVAWQKMGLRPDPLTQQIDKNLSQAKVAIDMAARMAEALDKELDDDDRRRIQSLMSDLRMNFVRQSG